MGNQPVLTPKEVVNILKKMGFTQVRQRGSHKQFKHKDGRMTTVPFHAGKDISPNLTKQIAKDIRVTFEEFLSYR